jgi:hypothetical protein
VSLCFNGAPRHEDLLGEWRYSSTSSLTSAVDGEWSASRLLHFTPSRERTPGTHWIGGWVGPRASLDAVVKRKIPSPCRDSNPLSPSAVPRSYPGSLNTFRQWLHSLCAYKLPRQELHSLEMSDIFFLPNCVVFASKEQRSKKKKNI